MPPGVGYPGKNSRYTPPSSPSARRQSVNFNKQVGIGAYNTPGGSAYSQGKMFKYQDRLTRMAAFDANQGGRATPKVRMVPGAGSGPTYTGPARPALTSGSSRNLPAVMGSNLPARSGSNLPVRAGGNLPARVNSRTPMNPSRNLPATASGMGRTSSRTHVGAATYDRASRMMIGAGTTNPRRPVSPRVGASTARSSGGVGDMAGSALSKTRNGRGLMIGLGAAVIAGLAYAGRRDDGTSSGRSSAYRY